MDHLIEKINSKLYTVREQRIMVVHDIADLYQVKPIYLKQQVNTNLERFDEDDLMFQLTNDEFKNLKSKLTSSTCKENRHLPFVFTEQGVYMLATVLNSKTAIYITKYITRSFSSNLNNIQN